MRSMAKLNIQIAYCLHSDDTGNKWWYFVTERSETVQEVLCEKDATRKGVPKLLSCHRFH